MLEIVSLEKAYGHRRIIRGVDLTIEPGQILALLGPNGAGKTTLVSIVAGLRRADAGTVAVAGIDAVRHPYRVRRLIGLAPQELGIYPTLSARRNLLLFAEIAGLSRGQAADHVEEVASALGLTDLLERRAGVLSGGQQRRLHTAMAIVHRPRLLFLDEPTVGADVESRRQILRLVRALADDGCAVCYATHYLPEVEELTATVAILDRGRILATAPVADLIATHGTAGVRLIFDGDAPELLGFHRDGPTAFRNVNDPGRAAAAALAELGIAAARLESVEMVRPSLESAYLAITGRAATPDSQVEVARVVQT